MLKIVEIAKAWIAEANPTEEQKQLAQERLDTCNGCESLREQETFKYFYCGECHCPISKKVFSPLPGNEACPLKKWKK